MFEHELAQVVLLERSFEANSPQVRFRKEWQALRNSASRDHDVLAEQHPVDLFLKGKELDRAA